MSDQPKKRPLPPSLPNPATSTASTNTESTNTEPTKTELARLGAEVGALRTELSVRAEVGQATTELAAELADRLDELEQRVNTLHTQLDQVCRAGAEPHPVHWPSLSAQQAEQHWAILIDWVTDILAGHYQLTRAQLPDCWAAHRAAVLELVWLHTTYIHAYQQGAATRAAAEWHTRWRREALSNIAAVIPTGWCRPGQHLIHELEAPTRTVHDQHTATEAGGREPAGTAQRWSPSRGPGEQPAHPRYWQEHVSRAIAADLTARRRVEC